MPSVAPGGADLRIMGNRAGRAVGGTDPGADALMPARAPARSDRPEPTGDPRTGPAGLIAMEHLMRGILLWMVGIPIPLIILIYLLF